MALKIRMIAFQGHRLEKTIILTGVFSTWLSH
jgi:hypothetical protein